MVDQKKSFNSVERLNDSANVIKENFLLWKGLDEKNFNKFLESFGDEEEKNKVCLSKFLNNSNIKLSQLGSIKINIKKINNFVANKPDFPKDVEEKIAKLFLKNFYEKGKNIVGFTDEFENRICSIQDLNKKGFNFKTIQICIRNFSEEFFDIIDETTVSNEEIFNALSLNQISTFKAQDLSLQPLIQDILYFEVKDLVKYVKNRGKGVEKDMEKTIMPVSTISELFDKVEDLEIEKLNTQKSKIEELENLVLYEDIYNDKVSLKQYIKGCEDAGIDEEFISKLNKLLLGAINDKKIKEFCKNEAQKINKKIWKKYIENFEKIGMNNEFTSVMKKLVESDFDFSKLEKKEQTMLWQTIILDKFDKQDNTRAKYAGIDQEKYKSFLKYLYDFEKEKTSISINGVGSLNLDIKKEVQGGENNSFADPDNFKNMDIVNPVKFTVNIDNNNKNFIETLEETKDSPLRVNGIMETHITKSGPLNIGNGYALEICGKKITKAQLDELLLCKDLPELNEKLKELGLFEELKDEVYNTRKDIFQPQNVYPNLDEDGFDTDRGNNSSTISYSDKVNIFEEVLKKLDVKVAKRDLIFEGKDVNKLSQLYIMSQLRGNEKNKKKENQDNTIKNIIGDYNRDGDEKLGGKDAGENYAEDVFKKLKSIYEDFDMGEGGGLTFDDYLQSLDDNGVNELAKTFRKNLNKEGKTAFKDKLRKLAESEEDEYEGMSDAVDSTLASLDEKKEEKFDPKKAEKELGITLEKNKEKTEDDKFLEERNTLDGDKSIEKMEKGVRLYFDLGETQLQPKDITDAIRSYYCFEVVNVGTSDFTIKAVGGDLTSSLVGKEYTFPKEKLQSIKKGGKIFRVRPRASKDWNSCLESINKAKFFGDKGITAFGNMKDQVHLDGSKFVNDKGQEIKYFDRVEGYFDDSKPEVSKWGQGVKIYKYEIKKVDTSKGTVKIASTFDDYDENCEKVTYEYENEMTYEQFILLMEGKRLKGYTEQEQKEMETKYTINDPGRLANKGRRQRVSIGSIINVFKNATKTIQSKIEENRKEQDEALENYLFSYEGLNLYGKLGGLLGGLGLSSLHDAMKKSEYEFYTNRENRTWKRIEDRYKIFQADPNYSELYKEQLIPILSKPGYRGNDKDRYQFAAAFLMMLKNEGPCPRDFTQDIGKGNWVEKFLGPEHKVRFLNFYEKKKNELEQVKDMGHRKDVRLDLQEELNKLEYMYIFNTIEGNAPHGPESNEFMLKSIWSTKFSGELKSNLDGYFEKHEETKNKMKTFYAAEEQYLRTVGAGRFNKALPSLERMCELANTPGEVFRAKGYLLGAMLMGLIKNNSTKETMKSFWGTARTMGFAPGFWIVDIESQDKIKILLDGVTNGEFSKKLGLNLANYDLGNLQDKKYELVKKFQGYWNGNGENILKRIENPSYKNDLDPNDKSIIDLAEDEKNPNAYIFKSLIDNTLTNEIDRTNPNINSVALYQKESPLSATSNTMKDYIPRKGQYSNVKKEEDRADAESFWQNVIRKKCIPKGPTTKQKTDFLFEKYFNRFNNTLLSREKERIVRSIPLIKERKDKDRNAAKYMLWYMIKGNMHEVTSGGFPTEFETVMNDFVDFFFDNIEHIDKATIEKTFKDDKELINGFDHKYILFDLNEYRRYKMNNNSNSGSRNRYEKLFQLELRKLNIANRNIEGYQEVSREDTINYQIEQIWRECDKYGVSPKINISTSKAGINLNARNETNDTINKKQNMAEDLDDHYDSLTEKLDS